jgi:hypothetical protein
MVAVGCSFCVSIGAPLSGGGCSDEAVEGISADCQSSLSSTMTAIIVPIFMSAVFSGF